ncbi:xanthine dehydrogenase small subunit [Niveibacterium microcysteis]|uniref:Xanthine dehydrogenase small subunit n=1 Tax=Niveibacterium microcysteis TaxID=2811415 RepID=A0ABX7ME72_9RHOO|nr:xanthine dehydrogenase small subunit [Niveibacterium microcysteis]QSI79060.1 xanthine dehydrogenase small subunit [Niveibacterium microcysteis]
MTARPIQFYFRGAVQQISGKPTTRSVLQWLREDACATGTKEGCAEGDCGACTVVIGERDDSAPGGLKLTAVNACIQFLPTLDGKALFTVEDLADGGDLHPVQQAMVDCHASQCGFCTPGFAMSLWADYETRSGTRTREQTLSVLSGNLCRCTGYRPIIDAATAAHARPRVAMDRAPVRAALDLLAALPALEYQSDHTRFFAPRTVDELASTYLARPSARLLAGSTDIGLWVTKQMRDLPDLIYLGAVTELRTITRDDDQLVIGAGATLTEAFAALVAANPAWQELAERFASMPIRNAGTLGGNIANGSPIGDSMPGLIALGASVLLQRGDATREIALEDLYLGYQKSALQAGEFVRAIRVPCGPAAPTMFRTWKVSKRADQDISAVCAGIAVSVRDGLIESARVAFGGMAATPSRAPRCEAALLGQPWSAESVRAAMLALSADYMPLTDMRATANYRNATARNLLWRFWLETAAPATAPTRLAEVSA